MPPPTSVPSATLVELLWGHPEQKQGVRVVASGREIRERPRPGPSSQAAADSIPWTRPSRCARPRVTASTSSSPKRLNRVEPSSWVLPTTFATSGRRKWISRIIVSMKSRFSSTTITSSRPVMNSSRTVRSIG